jgi:hypothetical protein
MRKGSVVAQSLEVDELHQDVWVLFRIAVRGYLCLHKIDLSPNDFFFNLLVLGLSDGLDQVASFTTESAGYFFILKKGLHVTVLQL